MEAQEPSFKIFCGREEVLASLICCSPLGMGKLWGSLLPCRP